MLAEFFDAPDACFHVFEGEFFGDIGNDENFFCDGIHQRKMRVRVKHGEKKSGEAAARADIDHARAVHQRQKRSRSKTRRVVVPFQVVDILAGNEIDFGVPLAVKHRHRFDFFPNFRRILRERRTNFV